METKNYLCKCNNCDVIIIDQNPQINAKMSLLNGGEVEMKWNESEQAWVCPYCDTDAYLMDL